MTAAAARLLGELGAASCFLEKWGMWQGRGPHRQPGLLITHTEPSRGAHEVLGRKQGQREGSQRPLGWPGGP